jgi:hypothetical protein
VNLKKLLVILILAFTVSLSAFAHRDDESIIYNKDGLSVNAWGYSYISGEAGKGNFMSYPTRGRVKVRYNEHWLVFAEVDFSHFMQQDAPDNPVTQLWGGYDFGKKALFGNMFRNTIVRAGSLLTAGGFYIGPAYQGITYFPPINPFGTFSNAIQAQTEIIPGVTITADVGGKTATPFYEFDKRMSRTEISQRVDWVATKDEIGKPNLILSLYNATGFGENSYQRNAFSIKYSPIETLDLYAGMFKSVERISPTKTISETGGYALADYELYKVRSNLNLVPDFDIRTHAMFEKTNGYRDYTGYTGGVSLILNNEKYGRQNGSKIVIDYMKTTTQMNDGPKVDDDAVGIGFLILF